MMLVLGGCVCEVAVDVEYRVHRSPDAKIIGNVIRAKNAGEALKIAKRRKKQYPDASFVTRVRDE